MIVICITRETGLLRESGCNLKTVMRDCFSFIMVVGFEKAEKFPDWSDSFGRSEIAGPAESWTYLIARPALPVPTRQSCHRPLHNHIHLCALCLCFRVVYLCRDARSTSSQPIWMNQADTCLRLYQVRDRRVNISLTDTCLAVLLKTPHSPAERRRVVGFSYQEKTGLFLCVGVGRSKQCDWWM